MKQAMVESSASSAASHSFLLDDDSTLPFSAGDIVGQMDDKVRPTCIFGSPVAIACLDSVASCCQKRWLLKRRLP